MVVFLKKPPTTEPDLLHRCQTIEGLTMAQLAMSLGLSIPTHPLQRKGWVGQAIELALGTTAGCKSTPDFDVLGIELKTIPINPLGNPAESTFITSIPLLTIQQQIWHTSTCYAKLKRVLWIPIEGDRRIAFEGRRIGRAVLWSPNVEEENILERDWSEFAQLISLGRLGEIDARMGEYLQVRPKAANAKSLCFGLDEEGNKILTMPRGFYLRSRFTAMILS